MIPITKNTKPGTNKMNKDLTRKTSMPPIVIEDNHNSLKKDLQNNVKGRYTLKYTNNSTIIYVEEQNDYKELISSVNESKISYHTSRNEKSHAFVLRGLTTGITTEQIEEDIMHAYDIKAREIYKMSTKNRPLFLITDPAITLDFLKKHIRVVKNTRVVWELRKSTKSIIQCHNCQAWGHATANCGHPPKCLKYAENHHTRTCV
ncbi:unnamed protein product [Psylliodes chrysocephalus]|uniref:Pre-C2HC domain-containing protein n=1 Tax=Psylliodes chrysocephalus TaxID=3402493 RepID=A0A9P0G4C9_9CUCU|nr:unnamed protein product [Psylliodes chrysocephala]